MRWSLDELYTSFQSESFNNDIEKLDQLIKEVKAWAKTNLKNHEDAKSKAEYYISKEIQLSQLFSKLMAYSSLTVSVEAKNQDALKAMDKLHVKHNELVESSVAFEKWLSSVENLDKLIECSDILKEHEFYLRQIVERSKYLLSEELEVLIAKMSNTGSKAWEKLQNVLTSTLLVDMEIDGEQKQLPLPVVRNMAYDSNADTRRKAYEAELKAYKKIEESSAACLNGIKGEVLTVSELRGYNSPLEETIIKSRIDQLTLDTMLEAMKESLPDFHRYYRKKAEILGHKNGLPFFDLFAPIGKLDMKFTYDEARKYIVDKFRTFSDKLADFADKAFEKRWIDAEQREGKRGGACCFNLFAIGESRILSNFSGSFSSMTTLAHELGHGYHGHCLKSESILNCNYTMPIAETASIFCETIIMNAALKEATPEQAFSILEMNISDAGQVIVDIYSRFIFESAVFNTRKDHSLSVEEIKELMIQAQKQAYGDSLDHNYLHPYMWICKPHYFFTGRNFYNFPYAFGLLFSKGVYAEYLKRGKDFVPEYDRLLNATGRNNIIDVARMVGIDIHSIDFWRSSLNLIRNDINRFIELANELLS
ncbi:MAG TPA: M3 family oligoendopeptidase [Clostridiales bacterium]|nr:M3 family oligoendopeptidase [Clostridiales bacterium]